MGNYVSLEQIDSDPEIMSRLETMSKPKTYWTPPIRPNGSLSFLSLPAEIRLKVYEYIIPTLDPKLVRQFFGLLMSCHLVRDELTYEIVKKATAWINSVHAAWPFPQAPLLITLSQSPFGVVHRLKIRVPKLLAFNERNFYLEFNQKTEELCALLVENLYAWTLYTYVGADPDIFQREEDDQNKLILRFFSNQLSPKFNHGRNDIIFDTSTDLHPESFFEIWSYP
ncbi:hypothetical protein K505DRAFT_355317 [Melanomma pulvis-pyrius CBS 109.77]|uniref:F-box domain-containing protein n=1 Tax=Melanomma pulvis-pyrius CBS 109.77 TaxID=1314802 RepID=A0A6A6XWI6_9PLEO|nr:hypothetical protein K505DRAFT_355317 [Melanomma pulvis-pyrius CBS 109.77]